MPLNKIATIALLLLTLLFAIPQSVSAQGSCTVTALCEISDGCDPGYEPSLTYTQNGLCSDCDCNPTDVQGGIGVACPEGETYLGIFDACLNFATTISWGISASLVFGTLIAAIRLAMGIIKLALSSGDPSALQDGRETMQDAILGIVLVSIAWMLFTYLEQTLPPEWQINFLNPI